jgi:hypothetical protein
MDKDSFRRPLGRNLGWALLFPLVFAGHVVLGTLAWIIVWLVTR